MGHGPVVVYCRFGSPHSVVIDPWMPAQLSGRVVRHSILRIPSEGLGLANFPQLSKIEQLCIPHPMRHCEIVDGEAVRRSGNLFLQKES